MNVIINKTQNWTLISSLLIKLCLYKTSLQGMANYSFLSSEFSVKHQMTKNYYYLIKIFEVAQYNVSY